MKAIRPTALFLAIISITSIINAQQFEQALLHASAQKGVQEFFYENASIRSGAFMYVAGASIGNGGDYDMMLTKYQGTTELWSVTWDGASNGDDFAASLALDNVGNVIIAGASYVGNSLNYDAALVKFNSNGTFIWSTYYSGPSNLLDGFVSVTTDASGNIYACGGTSTTSQLSNFLTVKYSSTGALQWDSQYDFNNMEDVAVKLVLGGNRVRVCGGSQNTASDWKMSMVSYNTSNGVQTGAQQTGGDNNGVDFVTDAWTDGTYTYVTGAVSNAGGLDWKVIKLDDDLSVLWSDTYNGSSNLDDAANSITVDAQGNVYVTGYSTNGSTGKDFFTRKYNSVGSILWSTSNAYPGADEATSIEIDSSGNAIVAGSTFRVSNTDFALLKLRGSNGSTVWETNYNSPYNDDDIPSNIAINDDGEIFVVGIVGLGDGTTTYMMCKYIVRDLYLPNPSEDPIVSAGYQFNQGQLRNNDDTPNSQYRFHSEKGGTSTAVSNARLSYSQSVIDDDTLTTDTLCRVDLKWTKGLSVATVYPYGESSSYNSYVLGHMTKPAERLYHYQSLIKSEVYTNTDVIFTHSQRGTRQWVVARAGAPTNSFEMTFDGHSSLNVDSNGHLEIETDLGGITLKKAKAYTLNIATGDLTLLSWEPDYLVSSNSVSFTGIGLWTGILVLEIDELGSDSSTSPPSNLNLEWSTYYGTNGSDGLSAIEVNKTTDDSWVTGHAGGPVINGNPGTALGNYDFVTDIVVGRFNSQARNLWNFYYGGDGTEGGNCLVASENNDIYVAGNSYSTNLPNLSQSGLNYSADDGIQNVIDGFVLGLDENGEVIMDSYLATSEHDEIYDVALGSSNSVLYIAGYTGNIGDPTHSGFPFGTTGAGYTQAANDGCEGFILAYNLSTESIPWFTYFGGDGDDVIFDLETTGGHVYIAGITSTDTYSSDGCSEPFDGGFPSCNSDDWSNTWTELSGYEYNYFVAGFGSDELLDWSSYVTNYSSSAFLENKVGLSARQLETGATDLFLTGISRDNTFSNFDIEVFGDYNIDPAEISTGGTFGFVNWFTQVNGAYDLKWSTPLSGYTREDAVTVKAKPNSNMLMIAGSSLFNSLQDEMDYCTIPDQGVSPLCDFYQSSYMETIDPNFDERSFLMVFESTSPRWITLFGADVSNTISSCTFSSDKIYIAGRTSDTWTLWDYDNESILDYYWAPGLDENTSSDGTIARFHIPMLVGIDEYDKTDSSWLNIYPNPSRGDLNVQIDRNHSSGAGNIMIFNSSGKLVVSKRIEHSLTSIDVSDLANGLYVAKFISNSSSAVKRFILEK